MSANPATQPKSRQFIEIARPLVERGIPVIPVQPYEKRCLLPDWPKLATTNLDQIERWNAENPRFNVGAVGKPDRHVILDCDVVGLRERIERETGHKFPRTLIVKSAGKGAEHIYLNQTDPSRALRNRKATDLFDLQSVDRYVVGPGSTLSNGKSYEIVDDSPIADFPDWLADWIEQHSDAAKEHDGKGAPVHDDLDFDHLCAHLDFTFHSRGENKHCFEACPYKGDFHTNDRGEPDYGACVLLYDGSTIGFSCLATSCEGYGKSIHDLIRHRYEQGYEPYPYLIFKEESTDELIKIFGAEEANDQSPTIQTPVSTLPDTMDVGEYERIACTDVANGKRLAKLCGYEIAYSRDESKWYVWSGKIWREDIGNVEIVRKAKSVARSIFVEADAEADDNKSKALAMWAIKSQSKERLLAMVWAAQSEGTVAKSKSEFDAIEYLYTVNNGVVDLRTGGLLPHSPRYYLTEMSPYNYLGLYKGNATQWEKFFNEALPDKEVQGFIKRGFGYSMFGTSREESIIYLYGTGNDGKGVLLFVKNKVMGGYSAPAEYKTFASMGKNGRGFGGHSDDIAGLAGKRDVYVDETDQGGRLNEGLIKTITGGGRQRASFKGKSGFEFQPQFTMWWASNFKPRLTDVGKSMRRRIKMVHMNLGLDEEKADKTLKTRLVAEEGDAILTWMIEGAVEWYQKGLAAPAAVREWTEQYFHDEDVVGMWLEECCKQGPAFSVRATPAFKAFKGFCIENGYHHEHIDMKAFKKQLESKGFQQKPTKVANVWFGFEVERFFYEEPKIDAGSVGSVM